MCCHLSVVVAIFFLSSIRPHGWKNGSLPKSDMYVCIKVCQWASTLLFHAGLGRIANSFKSFRIAFLRCPTLFVAGVCPFKSFTVWDRLKAVITAVDNNGLLCEEGGRGGLIEEREVVGQVGRRVHHSRVVRVCRGLRVQSNYLHRYARVFPFRFDSYGALLCYCCTS